MRRRTVRPRAKYMQKPQRGTPLLIEGLLRLPANESRDREPEQGRARAEQQGVSGSGGKDTDSLRHGSDGAPGTLTQYEPAVDFTSGFWARALSRHLTPRGPTKVYTDERGDWTYRKSRACSQTCPENRDWLQRTPHCGGLRGTGDVPLTTDQIMALTRGEPRPRKRRRK